MRVLLLGLAVSWLLGMGPVRGWAQAPSAADTFTYHPQARKARNLGGALLPGSGRVLLLETRQPKGHPDSLYLSQQWLDPHLRPERRLEVGLRGHHLQLTQAQTMGRRILVRLGNRDSLHLLALDSTGRTLAQVREPLPRPPGDYDQLMPELPRVPGLVTLTRWHGDAGWVLAYRGRDLRFRWQQKLGQRGWGTYPGGPRLRWYGDSTHLWLLITSFPTARHPATTALCISLANGAVLSERQLAPTAAGNQRLVTAHYLNPDHSLWLAGHAYRGRAVNTHHSGDLFALRLGPQGGLLDSAQFDARHLAQQARARGRRISWQAVAPDPAGGLGLVGETYTTTPAMASYVRGLLSLFLLSYDVLRPKDLLLLHLPTTGGQPPPPRLVPLTADRNSLVSIFYASPLAMELLADDRLVFRSRGLGDGNQTLVLHSPQRVQAVDLSTGRLRLLRLPPVGYSSEVLYVGPDYVLLAEARSLRTGLRLVRLPLLPTP